MKSVETVRSSFRIDGGENTITKEEDLWVHNPIPIAGGF